MYQAIFGTKMISVFCHDFGSTVVLYNNNYYYMFFTLMMSMMLPITFCLSLMFLASRSTSVMSSLLADGRRCLSCMLNMFDEHMSFHACV